MNLSFCCVPNGLILCICTPVPVWQPGPAAAEAEERKQHAAAEQQQQDAGPSVQPLFLFRRLIFFKMPAVVQFV